MTAEQRYSADGLLHVTVDVDSRDIIAKWTDTSEILVRGAGVDAVVEADELFVTSEARRRNKSEPIELELPSNPIRCEFKIDKGDIRLFNALGKVDAKTDSGDIAVEGGAGALALATGRGEVSVTTYQGEVISSSGSGDAKLTDIDGPVTVRAGRGDIKITGGAGATTIALGSGDTLVRYRECDELTAAGGSGDISVEGGSLGRASITTASGDIRCHALLDVASYDLTASSGDISLSIQRGLVARVDAATTRGSISSDLPLVAINQRGPRNPLGKRLVGSTGDSPERAEITIRTTSGDIDVRWAGESSATSTRITRHGSDRDFDVRWGAGGVPVAGRVKGRFGGRDIEFRWGEGSESNVKLSSEHTNASSTTPSSSETEQAETSASPTMDDDRKRAVLSALADGALSVEEAGRLLDIIDQSTGNSGGE